MKRRDFLETSTKILCACAAGSGLAIVQGCTSNVATSPDPNEESEELIIDLLSDGFTALLEQGGSVVTDGNIIDSQGLLLYRTGSEVRAFRNNCTHSGGISDHLLMGFLSVSLGMVVGLTLTEQQLLVLQVVHLDNTIPFLMVIL